MRQTPRWRVEEEIRAMRREYDKLSRKPIRTPKEEIRLRQLPSRIYWTATGAGLPNPLQTAACASQ